MILLRILGSALLISSSCLLAQAESDGGSHGHVPGSTQALDEKYSSEIREHTTNPCFLTPYVEYLPASEKVPTPKAVLGHIAGAPDVLSYSHQVHKYMRAVAAASPRVKVFRAGRSEEGREMILVVVSDERTIRDLDRYKKINNQLADPRQISELKARGLAGQGKPMYWATGAMHSTETGSPEMLMELVYRLAVDESPFVRAIRAGLIFMCTPVLDVDGRDKRVDLLKLSQADEKASVPRLLYWGKYVAHDNNRDAMIMGLELSKMLMRTFLDYKPQVLHDLHESASHLYTSTGTGPYNPWLDPILVDEWHVLAYQEVTELTRLGVPGVWTHDFYDGWAASYGFYVANGHNAIGRFYETQGAGSANTRRISSRATRAWYRPNPPLASTMWSMRNNVNLQQSGLLVAMNHVAKNRQKFMYNFYLKSKRSVAKARNEGPAAYVFPANDARPGQAAALLNVLKSQGCEVHQTVRDTKAGKDKRLIPAGSHIVRMDQPYSRMADMLLDRAYYNAEDSRPYDDTGWTLGPLFNAEVWRIEDVGILDVYMSKVEGPIKPAGGLEVLQAGKARAYLINHNADNALATFRFAHGKLQMLAAEKAFELSGQEFRAGTFILPVKGNPSTLGSLLDKEGKKYGFVAYATAELPEVPTHSIAAPRVALVHTWTSTQSEGWVRMALDSQKIPYAYISVHDLRDEAKLRDKYDVIMFGPSSPNALSIVRGLPKTGDPIPWKATRVAPNIGRQAKTDDMRGGLELEGVLHLRDFVEAGGVFLTIQSSCSLPVHFGLARGVTIQETENLMARGSVLRAQFTDQESPISYGYDDELGVYFRQAPVLSRGSGFRRSRSRGSSSRLTAEERILAGTARPTGRGSLGDPDRPQGRALDLGKIEKRETEKGGSERSSRRGRGRRSRSRTSTARSILSFHKDHKSLLISGMLAGGDELAGKPAIMDAPLGKGHVLLYAINPMWRQETQGSFFLIFNALLHYDHLDAGRKTEKTPVPKPVPKPGKKDKKGAKRRRTVVR